MTAIIPWNTGDGDITLAYNGQGNGTIEVSSVVNNLSTSRQRSVKVFTKNITKNVSVKQAACPLNFRTADGGIIKTADGKWFEVTELSTKSYIQDGLIFELDGIEKGDSGSNWTDLIGGLKFPYTNCVAEDNCVTFSGTGVTQTVSSLNMAQDNCTIEFACSGIKTGSFILFPAVKGHIMAGFSNNSYYLLNIGSNKANRYIMESGITRVSATVDSCIANGFGRSVSGTDSWSAQINGNIKIGGRGTDYLYTGKIYAIRVYNRKLSTDEMIQNQEVDRRRFTL